MLQTWRKFWRLDKPKKLLAIRAALRLLTLRVGLRFLSFATIQRSILLPFAANANPLSPDRIEKARSIARMATKVSRRLFSHPNCVENSLALCWLLRREGIPADLRLGGRKDSAQFEAHAWVECAGAVLTDANGEYRDYVPFGSSIDAAETRAR